MILANPTYKGTPLYAYLLFLSGLTVGISFQAVGRFYAGEFILLGTIFVHIILGQKIRSNRSTLIVFLSGTLLLCFTLVSNLYNSTPFPDFARGSLNLALFLLYIVAFSTLFSQHTKSAIAFFVGYGAGLIILGPADHSFTIEHFWKFGGGTGITYMVLGALALWGWSTPNLKKFIFTCCIIFFVLAAVSIYFDARSRAFVLLATVLFLMPLTFKLYRRKRAKVKQLS